MFEEEIKDKILKYIKNISVSSEQNYEIEFKFFYQNDMSYSIYNKLLDFYSAMNLNNKIEIIKETSIDILYKEYRFSIIGIDELNEVLNKNTYKQNNVLLKYFINKIQNSNSNNYIAIKKIKKEYININDYNILFKKAYEVILSFDELNIIKNDNINNNDIQFRYKDRIKLVIENEKNYTLQLDLTNVRLLQNYMDITTLYNKKKTYELELDLTVFDNNKNINENKIYDKMILWTEKIIKFIQQSNIYIKGSEINNVIQQLNKLTDNNDVSLPIMNVYSFEKQNINNVIQNYTVCDKADGERYFCYIYNNNLYLISNGMIVKKIKEKNIFLNNLNDTILDGEYLYSKKYKKYILYIFDILFYKGQDVRENDLNKRFNFLLKLPIPFTFKHYSYVNSLFSQQVS